MKHKVVGLVAISVVTVLALFLVFQTPAIELTDNDRDIATKISEDTGVPVNVVLVGLLAAKTNSLTGAEGTMGSSADLENAVRVCFGEFRPEWSAYQPCTSSSSSEVCVAIYYVTGKYVYVPCKSY